MGDVPGGQGGGGRGGAGVGLRIKSGHSFNQSASDDNIIKSITYAKNNKLFDKVARVVEVPSKLKVCITCLSDLPLYGKM